MTQEYANALDAVTNATRAYFAAAALYRAGEMSDAEYIAARAAYKAADDAFDVAYRAAEKAAQ